MAERGGFGERGLDWSTSERLTGRVSLCPLVLSAPTLDCDPQPLPRSIWALSRQAVVGLRGQPRVIPEEGEVSQGERGRARVESRTLGSQELTWGSSIPNGSGVTQCRQPGSTAQFSHPCPSHP